MADISPPMACAIRSKPGRFDQNRPFEAGDAVMDDPQVDLAHFS
ncbi:MULTISPECIES: hypothetical protein [unclassified Bradyrhizobium]|nr:MULTISPECIES: hypothetical protein [unclassified Bradyrhizobium]